MTAQVAEAGVYTVESYRGRGYAAETVRGWAAAIRAMGRLPLYSTSWANTASPAVARKLRAVQYAVDFSLT
jgi:predicted GNAT family acetyltransferase